MVMVTEPARRGPRETMYSSTYGAHQKLPPSWNIPGDIALNLEPGGPLGAERKQQELFPNSSSEPSLVTACGTGAPDV